MVLYLFAYLRDPLRRRKIEHHLVAVPRRELRHHRAERADADASVRQRMTQPESLTADVAPVIVGALAAQDRAQALDGFAHSRGTVRPIPVVPARHNEWTGRTQRHVDLAAGERGNRTRPQRD